MIGIVALLVVVGLAVVLWRLVSSQYGESRQSDRQDLDSLGEPGGREARLRRPRKPTTMLPPDDDPEFLADLARRARRDDEPQ